MSRPPVFPAEQKTRIVLSILAGEITIAEAARQYKVSEQSVGTKGRVGRVAGVGSRALPHHYAPAVVRDFDTSPGNQEMVDLYRDFHHADRSPADGARIRRPAPRFTG